MPLMMTANTYDDFTKLFSRFLRTDAHCLHTFSCMKLSMWPSTKCATSGKRGANGGRKRDDRSEFDAICSLNNIAASVTL